MNHSDLLLKKRKASAQRQKRGCCGSTALPIVVAGRSWREISCGKLGTLIQQTKNSLNFVSTCLKVVDTRRVALIAICWGVRFAVTQERRRTQEFLQAKYQELNRTYFHNQLPPAQIDWADLTEENRVGKTYLKEGNRYLVRCG